MKSSFLKALLCFIVAMFCSKAIAGDNWFEESEHTRQLMREMDKAINARHDDSGYAEYMSLFAEDIEAWGLIEPGPAYIETVRHHYKPVFEFFEDGVLVTESLVVAGNMAAQRYHSLFRLNGTFDGVTYKGKRIAIRGITFFQFDENDKIKTRWSNHDHAYRMGQLLGKEGEAQGKILAKKLNGPSLSEQTIYKISGEMFDSFNQIHDPQLRSEKYFSYFDSFVIVHGIKDKQSGLRDLKTYFQELWSAFPDLVITVEEKMSAWSMIAIRWKASGSHRGKYRHIGASWKPIMLSGETILRFNELGKVTEMWMNLHPIFD